MERRRAGEMAWLEMECGLMHDGQCSMAGSEHCDFTCPRRDSEDFAGSAAWIKKHKRNGKRSRPRGRVPNHVPHQQTEEG
jgi:hypothetical protein